MKRVTKKPEIRRNEILDKAQELFYTIGYNKTSVERIINSLDLAKGTFYYYFRSKLDLVEALAERHSEEHYLIWEKIIQRKDLNAIQKFNLVFQSSSNLKARNPELIKTYLNAYISEENNLIRHQMNKHRTEKASQILGDLIKDGCRERVFDTPYPEESIRMIFALVDSMSEEIIQLLIKMFKDKKYKDDIIKKYKMLEMMTERILGAEKGSLKFFDRGVLDFIIE